MNKLERDFKKGEEFRRKVEGKLSCNGLLFIRVHEYLKWLGQNRGHLNKTVFRLLDKGDSNRMGLDYIGKVEGESKHVHVIIRRFSDPSIFIKDSIQRDLISHYEDENAFIIFVDEEISKYHILSMNDIKSAGWVWRSFLKGNGNSNRVELWRTKGEKMKPFEDLSLIPLEGDKTLFDDRSDFWTTFKRKMKHEVII